jgi:ATP-binding protein involved in chromosome partitioning
MMGVRKEPDSVEGRIIPVESHGVRFMSLGLIAGEDTPVIWRGPIVGKMIQQFLSDVDWGELDYLVIDLPPGTGDAQLTLAQTVSLDGTLVVTTPQAVALEDVRRGIEMFRKVDVPVLGIIENMASFKCDCGTEVALFGRGGAKAVSQASGVPLLGSLPFVPALRIGGDAGVPAVLADPQAAGLFEQMAGKVADLAESGAGGAPEITIR